MMKKDISHLPSDKQQELRELVQAIRAYYPPVLMIILFGSYARGNWVEEKYEDNIHYRYQSDFDVLVLIEDRKNRVQQRIEQEVEECLSQSDKINTPVSILVHDLDFVNAHLAKTQYFFSDIAREGILLHGSGKFQLQKAKKLTKQERQKLAQEDFEFWFDSALEFSIDFQHAFERASYNKAAFELHQTVERFYTTVLLVYTRYKPNTHDLRTLRKMVNSIDDRLCQVFLLDTPTHKRLFNLLRAAYVDARYKKSYVITKDELYDLQQEVAKLQALVEAQCKEKIATLGE